MEKKNMLKNLPTNIFLEKIRTQLFQAVTEKSRES